MQSIDVLQPAHPITLHPPPPGVVRNLGVGVPSMSSNAPSPRQASGPILSTSITFFLLTFPTAHGFSRNLLGLFGINQTQSFDFFSMAKTP
jgi:hypothetical protein